MSASKSQHYLSLAGLAIAAIIALFAMPSAAAEDSKQPQYVQHTFQCLTWLLTDPAMHAANCAPARPSEFPDPKGLAPLRIGLVSTGAWTDSCEQSDTECEEEPCLGTGCEEPPPCDPETETCEEEPPCNPETETCQEEPPPCNPETETCEEEPPCDPYTETCEEEPPCTGTEEECTPM